MDFTTLDFALLILFVLAAVVGFMRGFLASFGAIFSTLVAAVSAFHFRAPLVQSLEEQFGLLTVTAGLLNQKIPALAAFQAAQEQITRIGQAAVPGAKAEPGAAVLVSPAEQLASGLLTVIAFVALFFVISIVLKFIFNILNKIFNHGALGFINRMAGMVLEVAKYAIIVAVLLMVINPLLQTCASMGFNRAETTQKAIKESVIAGNIESITRTTFWNSE